MRCRIDTLPQQKRIALIAHNDRKHHSLETHPHHPHVRTLLRVAVMQNIPVACNRASADFLFSSALMDQEYEKHSPDYEGRLKRERVIEQVGFPAG